MKKFIALLLALVMVLSLAACSVEEVEPTVAPTAAPAVDDNAEVQEETPAMATELTLWVYPVGGWGNQETVEGLMAQFKEATGITVTVEYLTYADGDAKIDTAIEGKVAPDLVMEGPERLVANWGAKGKLVNIADLFDAEDKEQLNAAALTPCFADENTAYEYPMCMTAHSMAINKAVFEAAGAMQYIDEETHTWTTENFWKAVQAVYEYTGKQVGAVFCNSQAGDQGTRALINNLYGGTFTNAEYTAYDWGNEGNVKALEAIMASDGAIKIDPAMTASDEIAMFYNGTLNMAFCWNAAQQANPNSANTGEGKTANGDEIMYMCFPSEEGTDVQLCGGIWGFGIFDNGDAGRIAAAKEFIKYFCDGEGTIDGVKASSFFAVRTVAGGNDMSALWDGNALMLDYSGKMMARLGDYYNVTPNWTAARAAWWDALQKVKDTDGSAEAIKAVLDAGAATANAG